MKKCLLISVLSLAILSSCEKNAVSDTDMAKNDTQKAVFYIDGALPDIGEFSGNSHASYFDEPVYDFVPGEYGRLIPFINSVKNFGYVQRASYGLCDENGKTVMDASENCIRITYEDGGNGYGVYIITKENPTEYQDPFDMNNNVETVIADGNGLWSKTLKNGWFNSISDRIIHVTNVDTKTVEIVYEYYSDTGEKLLNLSDYGYSGSLNRNRICVESYENGFPESYILNLEGEILSGPYKAVSGFNKYGLCAVTDMEDNAYFIDADINRYADDGYSKFSLQYGEKYSDGVFIMQVKDTPDEHHVYDAEGSFKGVISEDATSYFSVRLPKNGEIIYYYTIYSDDYSDSKMVWKRLSDGSDFVSKELGIMPNTYYGTDDFFICTTKDDKAYIIDCEGETVAVIDNYFHENIEISRDGRYIAYNSGESPDIYNAGREDFKVNDTRRFTLYDTKEKKVLFSSDKPGSAYFSEDSGRYIKIHLYNQLDLFASTAEYCLYDTYSEKLVLWDCILLEETVIDGAYYYNVCTENSCTLYDENLKVIRKQYND